MKPHFANCAPFFRDAIGLRKNIRKLMRRWAEENRLFYQPRKTFISWFNLQNQTLIKPLLTLFMPLGLVWLKIEGFVELNLRKRLNDFIQSAAEARRQNDKNPKLSGLWDNKTANEKLLWISTNSTKLVHKKVPEHWENALYCKQNCFKKFRPSVPTIVRMELARTEIEHKDPVDVRFFILQCAKLGMVELYQHFCDETCDIKNFEELEMDENSLYFAVAEGERTICLWPEMEAKWGKLRTNDCDNDWAADRLGNFFPHLVE